MGGVYSGRRSSDSSGDGHIDRGHPSTHFDSSWDEYYHDLDSRAGGQDALGAVGEEGERSGNGLSRWPPAAEDQLARLYSNDKGYRTRSDGNVEPLSLLELCVRALCRRLGKQDGFPATLPREIVDRLLGSLTEHRALSCHALGAFRHCEVTYLSLGSCRGVRNGWVRHLLGDTRCGRCLVSLDLSSCTGLTDNGLSSLPALGNLESASLRHCHGLGAEATLCLANSPSLRYLSLAHCPRLDDAAVENLSGLSKLRSLDLEGCEGVTDEGFRLACGLPSLTCLNVSRCHGITMEGLAGLGQAADRLKRLNLGWCQGLARAATAVASNRSSSDDDDNDNEGGDHDCDDDGEDGDGDGYGDQGGDGDGDRDDGPGHGDGAGGGEGEGDRPDEGGRGGRRRSRMRGRRRWRSRRRRNEEWALPPLPRLEKLCLARSGIADAGLSRLAAGSPELTDLEVSGCMNITADGVQVLSALDKLEKADFSQCRRVQSVTTGMSHRLHTLSLAGTSVQDFEVHMVSRELTQLTSLSLDSCDMGDSGLRALSALTKLERLNLADTGVTDAGMTHLSSLTRLRDLNLFFCAITDSGLGPIASLTGLTRLNLDTRNVGDAGIVQLTSLRRLETLDVFSAFITDFGVAHGLCRMPSLTALEVCSGRLTDRGLHHLSRVKTLTRLNVSQNLDVTPVGVRHIGTLTRLRSLNLSCCSVTPASLDSLTDLVNLESLAVFGCHLERADLDRLRGKLPNLKVVRA